MRLKPAVIVVTLACFMYYAHRFLQLQYFRHCKADLIRIVLFDKSPMCVHISNALQLVEVAYHQVIKQITTQIVASLGGNNGMAWIGDIANNIG